LLSVNRERPGARTIYQKCYGWCPPIGPSSKPPGKIRLDKASPRASSAMIAAFSGIAGRKPGGFRRGSTAIKYDSSPVT
jgi:hypothetical protein